MKTRVSLKYLVNGCTLKKNIYREKLLLLLLLSLLKLLYFCLGWETIHLTKLNNRV